MNIDKNGYPAFWLSIKRGFNKNNINKELKCPMNYLYNYKANQYKPKESTIPIGEFFVNHELNVNNKTCRKVEELITKYSLKLMPLRISASTKSLDREDYLILRNDFNDLINTIQRMNISGKYLGLYSWLINRAFLINKRGINLNKLNSKIRKNRSILLKILYDVNRDNLLKCFSKDVNMG